MSTRKAEWDLHMRHLLFTHKYSWPTVGLAYPTFPIPAIKRSLTSPNLKPIYVTHLLLSIIKRSQSFSKLLPLYCERFMMIYYSLLLSVFDGLQEAARHVCQRMESMATSRMMKADSGRMYHGKEMA